MRCKVCRKGIIPIELMRRSGGEPGCSIIDMIEDEFISFSCGHVRGRSRTSEDY